MIHPYMVSIPTRGRSNILDRTLQAIHAQTCPPRFILIVDNNDGDTVDVPQTDATSYSNVVVVNGRGKHSDATGSQQGLEFANNLNYDICIKWDDDLIPKPDCFEKLVSFINQYESCAPEAQEFLACGGMYPRTGCKLGSFRIDWLSPIEVVDNVPSHVQFFNWDVDTLREMKHEILSAPALYSSFAYSVKAANLIGGFCTDYSRLCLRHETDFTLRLAEVGSLVIDTSAKAEHLLAEGGIRDITDQERMVMSGHDESLFKRRMQSMGISPTDWRKGCK